jgi:hypothetical protein
MQTKGLVEQEELVQGTVTGFTVHKFIDNNSFKIISLKFKEQTYVMSFCCSKV